MAGALRLSGDEDARRRLTGLLLIDGKHLLVHPVFLRQGRALFDGSQPPARLDLVSAEPFPSGVVLLKYDPA
ncbi:hypothetical protein PSN13_03245 [Micromonospora saelicesensis]|uniref:Dihydrofolate reductase n=1 Tax=Micromonospora saelicesensis TaxID=285676 RepID=A0A328NM23_9ACTN|nr:hypothetical protein [Micromonospora saelicesensis]RAO34378.1 hypothetical protein PSN13_03245 [Micromonospora saelicesensis]